MIANLSTSAELSCAGGEQCTQRIRDDVPQQSFGRGVAGASVTCNQHHLPPKRTPRIIGTYLMSDPWNGGDEMLKWRASKTREAPRML